MTNDRLEQVIREAMYKYDVELFRIGTEKMIARGDKPIPKEDVEMILNADQTDRIDAICSAIQREMCVHKDHDMRDCTFFYECVLCGLRQPKATDGAKAEEGD